MTNWNGLELPESYFHDDDVYIIKGDCVDILPQLRNHCVELGITSPPYNMRTRIRNGRYTERERSEHFSKKYASFHDAYPISDYYNIHNFVLSEMIRLTKVSAIVIQIVTGSKEPWFKLIGQYSEYIKDIAIWDKGNGQPAMHEAVMNRCYELVLLLDSSKTAGRTFNSSYFARGTMPDMWRFGRGGNGKSKGHAAVFPEPLVAIILEGWSDKNAIVLDSFLGSGTTAIASTKSDRKCIGIEISEEYCELATIRYLRSINEQ